MRKSAAKGARRVAWSQLMALAEAVETKSDEWTVIQIDIRLGMLEKSFAKFDEAQSVLESANDDAEYDQRRRFEEAYAHVKEKLMTVKADLQPDMSHMSTIMSSTSLGGSRNKSVLPSVPLPTFDGTYSNWTDFITTFKERTNNECSVIDKFSLLKSCLIGSAALVIQSLACTEQNYERALDLLIQRYDNKRLIFHSHISKLLNIPHVQRPSAYMLRQLTDLVTGEIRALQSLATDQQIADGVLISLVSSKLDIHTRNKWEESAPLDRLPSWADFSTFLEKHCQKLEHVQTVSVDQSHARQTSSRKRDVTGRVVTHVVAQDQSHSGREKKKGLQTCRACRSADHFTYRCPKFMKLSFHERFNLAKRENLCLNCLKPGHGVKSCKSSACLLCAKKHHTTLHVDKWEAPVDSVSEPRASTSSTSLSLSENPHAPNARTIVLATAVVTAFSHEALKVECRALLDSASQTHIVTTRLAQRLRLKRNSRTGIIVGVGQSETRTAEGVRLTIASRTSSFSLSLDALVLPNITCNQPSILVDTSDWKIPQNVALADPSFFRPARVDLLIGAEAFMSLLSVGQISLGPARPILQKSLLGWLVSGPAKPSSGLCDSITSTFVCVDSSQDAKETDISDLSKQMKAFWEIEEIQFNKPERSHEEELCEQHFKRTTTRNNHGQFIVRLPFREDPTQLGSSRLAAKSRLSHIQRRFDQDPFFKREYLKFMAEYEGLGHMSPSPVDVPENKVFYLPHHGIMQGHENAKKLRVVFDASCAATSGKSLNSVLMVGPVIQDDLFSILCRFRRHAYVMTTDIIKMYRQILVDPQDANYQTILWQRDGESSVSTFRLDTVTYGTASAPFTATRCLKELSEIYKSQLPVGSRILESDTYVDDILTGADSQHELCEAKQQLISILGKAKMQLHKWCSNSEIVLNSIPVSERQTALSFSDEFATKTLGMLWKPRTDQFCFEFVPGSSSKKITKRTVLSIISTLFDPLGLVNPVIVSAKLFMQEIWKLGLHWDESLPSELSSRWELFSSELCKVNKIHVNRRISASSSKKMTCIQLHGFADASERAYGACVYLRVGNSNHIECNLICSKSRVSPIKPLSIPRLELCGIVLLCELIEKTSRALMQNVDSIVCWSDSTIALAWIRKPASSWKTFVSHRVAKVQSVSERLNITWRHVPTADNPADILSRGATPQQLTDNTLWFNGPTMLLQPESVWPKNPFADTQFESRTSKQVLVISQQYDVIETMKFRNSYRSTINVFAYVARFIEASRNRCARSTGGPGSLELSTQDLRRGEDFILRVIQWRHYKVEVEALQQGKPIPKSSKILCLNPFLDEANVLRVGGRLTKSNLKVDVEHPALLPKTHHFTKVVIRNSHRSNLHAGCLTTQALIRQKYWIPNSRGMIRSIISKCLVCFRCNPKPSAQLMGDLPSDRIQAVHPFYHCGVDFAGPFVLRTSRRSKITTKGYLSLFICFSTKAVHLEGVSELSTDAFIACLKRFIARRGRCAKITSDNATNFVGAKRQLSEWCQLFNSQDHISAVEKFCRDEHVQWEFIPPRSPHFGGLWEASIKKAKHHLARILGSQPMTFEEMATIFAQIEAAINSRPLTALSSDPADPEALTPGHFLIGRPLLSLPEPDLSEVKLNCLSRWQHLTRMHQHFWVRWSREYLTSLQERTKWSTKDADISVGTLVVVKEDNLPPNTWMLGRVLSVVKGRDGLVRVANIQTTRGVFKRAVHKLCVLPTPDNA